MRLLVRCLLVGITCLPAVAAAQSVNGRVLDTSTRQPVVAVVVRLLDNDKVVVEAISDSLGRFTVTARSNGRYRISGSRIGYADAVSALVELPAGETLIAELLMSSEAVKAAPLVLIVPRDRYLESKGFYERMQSNSGDFMTSEQIRRRNAFSLVDLLRGLRGVKIQRVNTRNEVYFSGTTCLPQIVLDGTTVRWGGKQLVTITALDDLVPTAHIDAIEAYRGGSGVPIAYQGPNASCGVILLWTRHK
ncbi:MAG: TonB-dependent receptor [Gemmatimonadota bacterium]